MGVLLSTPQDHRKTQGSRDPTRKTTCGYPTAWDCRTVGSFNLWQGEKAPTSRPGTNRPQSVRLEVQSAAREQSLVPRGGSTVVPWPESEGSEGRRVGGKVLVWVLGSFPARLFGTESSMPAVIRNMFSLRFAGGCGGWECSFQKLNLFKLSTVRVGRRRHSSSEDPFPFLCARHPSGKCPDIAIDQHPNAPNNSTYT